MISVTVGQTEEQIRGLEFFLGTLFVTISIDMGGGETRMRIGMYFLVFVLHLNTFVVSYSGRDSVFQGAFLQEVESQCPEYVIDYLPG